MEDKITTLKNKEFIVLTYLPVKKKSAIFKTIREHCKTKGYIDYPEVDAIFNSLLVLNYTEQNSDKIVKELIEIYDEMESLGVVSTVIHQIPTIEYNSMLSYLNKTLEDIKPELMEKK